MKFLLVGINAKFIHTNVGLYDIEAYAKKYLPSEISKCVNVAEYTINQPIHQVLQEIYLEKPDVIGFSCYIWNMKYVRELSEMAHKAMPGVDIWLGGPEVSFESQKQLEKLPQIKGIMVGEGEETFKELLSAYYEKICNGNTEPDLLSTIRGLVYKTCGQFIDTGLRPYIDLSGVPFPYENLEKFKDRILYYETSRGCPFSCKYCLSSVDKKTRIRDFELVKKELQFFLDNKVKQVKFVDRTFNCRVEHTLKIWRFIKEHDNGITNFHFEIAADLINDEMIEEISDMRPGLIQLEIGVQSTNPETIENISRKTDINLIRDRVRRIKEFGNTHIHLDLIAGLPFEDYESFAHSFDDVYKMKPDQLQLGFLKLLKGSLMRDEADKYGIIYQDEPPYEVISTKWLSYADICMLKDIEEIVETYYNSGQYVNTLSELEKMRTSSESDKMWSSPFKMYESIAKYFRKNGFFRMTPNREEKYRRLLSFIETLLYNPMESDIDRDCTPATDSAKEKLCTPATALKKDTVGIQFFRELLTLDYYLREKAKKHPSMSNTNYKWNKERNAITLNFSYNLIELRGIKKTDRVSIDKSQDIKKCKNDAGPSGRNYSQTIDHRCKNDAGPAGRSYDLTIDYAGGKDLLGNYSIV